jgi:hypothetical protein
MRCKEAQDFRPTHHNASSHHAIVVACIYESSIAHALISHSSCLNSGARTYNMRISYPHKLGGGGGEVSTKEEGGGNENESNNRTLK